MPCTPTSMTKGNFSHDKDFDRCLKLAFGNRSGSQNNIVHGHTSETITNCLDFVPRSGYSQRHKKQPAVILTPLGWTLCTPTSDRRTTDKRPESSLTISLVPFSAIVVQRRSRMV